MTNEERMERMQNEIDYLRKRIEVLEGRCVCPRPQRNRQWDYDDRPWWDDTYYRPCAPKVWL